MIDPDDAVFQYMFLAGFCALLDAVASAQHFYLDQKVICLERTLDGTCGMTSGVLSCACVFVVSVRTSNLCAALVL